MGNSRLTELDELREELKKCCKQCTEDTSGSGAPFWPLRISPSLAYKLLKFVEKNDDQTV